MLFTIRLLVESEQLTVFFNSIERVEDNGREVRVDPFEENFQEIFESHIEGIFDCVGQKIGNAMNDILAKVVETTALDQSSLNNIVESSQQLLIFFTGAERLENVHHIGIDNRDICHLLIEVASIIMARYFFGFFVTCSDDIDCSEKTRRVVARPEVCGDSLFAIVDVVPIEEPGYFFKGFFHLEEVGNIFSRLFPLIDHIVPVLPKFVE